MKNAKEVTARMPIFKVQIKGAPAPQGWTLKYMSGSDDAFQTGWLLGRWGRDGEDTIFGFGEPDEVITFDDKAVVIKIAALLREGVGVESEPLKL
jgi:hypothetical protein